MPDEAARIVEEAVPPVAGRAGLVQGVYGDCGNLELVVPDPTDGAWVFWFNADEDEHRMGAPVGRWSGGLFIDAGPGLLATRIAQARSGPDFLELLVIDAQHDLCRWHWTPSAGFVADGVIARSVLTCSALIETGDEMVCVLVRLDGRAVLLRAGLDLYPELTFRAGELATDIQDVSLAGAGPQWIGLVDRAGGLSIRQNSAVIDVPGWWGQAQVVLGPDDTLAVVGLDPDRRLQHWTAGHELIRENADPVEDLAVARSSRTAIGPLGGIEVVTRSGRQLANRVLAEPGRGRLTPAVEIVSAAWLDGAAPASLHRGPIR